MYNSERIKAAMEMRECEHVGDVREHGDYSFVGGTDGRTWTIIACPFCAVVFVAKHEIHSRAPLTLSPSIVGPKDGSKYVEGNYPEQILAPCMHHFWIKDGKVYE